MADLKQLAEQLKELGEAELKKLAGILAEDVETDLGLTKGGETVKADDGNPPTCPQGEIWNSVQQKCVPNVGP